jgi:hypothetical protein
VGVGKPDGEGFAPGEMPGATAAAGRVQQFPCDSQCDKRSAAATRCAVRQAARHITQFYDQLLAPSGLRTTQFSILAKLRRLSPMTINALAAEMVMDPEGIDRRR